MSADQKREMTRQTTTFKDREKLRKAYPDGYVALRGVTTINGHMCLTKNIFNRWWTGSLPRHGDSPDVLQGVEHGDFLPNVDPSDTATWACLLRDLAGAVGVFPGLGLVWVPVPRALIVVKVLGNHGGWQLASCDWDRVRLLGPLFDIQTQNPAEALVLARIQLREALARKGQK